MTKGKNNGAKNQRTREEVPHDPSNALVPTVTLNQAIVRLSTADFSQTSLVGRHVSDLLAQCQVSDAAAAIIPWFCDALPSAKSRKDYYADMSAFFRAMQQQGIHPYQVTGDHVDRQGRRGVCTHSLRKTALNNALEHGAKVEDVQQWAGHADLRTTQEYIAYKEKGAEEAARRCQIR